MGSISIRDKRILRHRLEEAKEFIEAAIEEVEAIKDEPCDFCYDSKTLCYTKQFAHTLMVNEPCDYCPMCGRDLKGEEK